MNKGSELRCESSKPQNIRKLGRMLRASKYLIPLARLKSSCKKYFSYCHIFKIRKKRIKRE